MTFATQFWATRLANPTPRRTDFSVTPHDSLTRPKPKKGHFFTRIACFFTTCNISAKATTKCAKNTQKLRDFVQGPSPRAARVAVITARAATQKEVIFQNFPTDSTHFFLCSHCNGFWVQKIAEYAQEVAKMWENMKATPGERGTFCIHCKGRTFGVPCDESRGETKKHWARGEFTDACEKTWVYVGSRTQYDATFTYSRVVPPALANGYTPNVSGNCEFLGDALEQLSIGAPKNDEPHFPIAPCQFVRWNTQGPHRLTRMYTLLITPPRRNHAFLDPYHYPSLLPHCPRTM